MKKEIVKGYKGFDKGFKCKGFQYDIGKTYKHSGDIKICNSGFHFCRELKNVDGFYNFRNNDNVYAEIEASNEVVDENDKTKSVTNTIKIIREISREELLNTLNFGKNNLGFYNTGDSNTGDSNTGDSNTGYRNTGDRNTGYSNTGDFNKTNRSSGVFCNQEPKMILFNKKTDMTFEEWRETRAYDVLTNLEKSKWIYFSNMNDEEKKKYIKSAETCDGYLKEIPRQEASMKLWNKIDKDDKYEIMTLPNFDLDVFNDIMELNITKKEYKNIINKIGE